MVDTKAVVDSSYDQLLKGNIERQYINLEFIMLARMMNPCCYKQFLTCSECDFFS